MKLLDLGTKDYKETLNIQYELIEKIAKKEVENTLILVEHPHVITLGRKGKDSDILDPSIPNYKIERGGEVTYHGFGQIVGYPIINCQEKKDINKFLRDLEEVIIITLASYNILSERKEKHTGVWIKDKKIASIGVSFKNWVSYHGFALNVSTDLSYFFKINPCGLDSSVMTSMEQISNKTFLLNDIKKELFKNTKLFFQ